MKGWGFGRFEAVDTNYGGVWTSLQLDYYIKQSVQITTRTIPIIMLIDFAIKPSLIFSLQK